jgi:serine protease Do
MPMDKQASVEAPTKSEDTATSFAKFGMSLERAHGDDAGVAVAEVEPDGIAADHGLQAGDVIVEAGGKPVAKPSEVAQAFAAAKADGHKSVLLRVKSGDAMRFLALPVQAAS